VWHFMSDDNLCLDPVKIVQYVKLPRSYKLNEKSLQHQIQLICSTELSIFFTIIPVHIGTFVPILA
jgi:hypothetical protein